MFGPGTRQFGLRGESSLILVKVDMLILWVVRSLLHHSRNLSTVALSWTKSWDLTNREWLNNKHTWTHTERKRKEQVNLQERLHIQASVPNLPHHMVPAPRVGAAVATSCPVLGHSRGPLPWLPTSTAARVAAGGGSGMGLEVTQALTGGGLVVVGFLMLAEWLLEALLAQQGAWALAFRVSCWGGDILKGSGCGQGGILKT